ncbi:phage portal protein (plasmid) [Orbus sturtevantii]|uniref:phage portal protein n=1 Tax=Orbus sturtevantii TaxID=3074109 RepID=UPI00370D8AE7
MTVQILDVNGQPFQPKKTMALVGSGTPYDAADRHSDQMANWRPYSLSPDLEINNSRSVISARIKDLVRNDGWASGGITRILDNTVGATFRPILKPDYRSLRLLTGIKGFDIQWADEYKKTIEAHYRRWALDTRRFCDVQRKLTLPQIFRLAFRHKLIDGDGIALLHYRLDKINDHDAYYATAIQIIDPDRLSNPDNMFDNEKYRGGVEINNDGAHVAYHIRKAHESDWFSMPDAMSWQRIPRETKWGRPIIIHDFDMDRTDQHRGTGIFTPILQRMKMLTKYDQSELESSILNAVFSAYIESPYDQTLVEEAMGEISTYQKERAEFHNDRRISLSSGAKMPILFPGEKITSVNAARPVSNFRDFESTVLRNCASAMGLSSQQLSQDWSDVNYSSARAALIEVWKTLSRRRSDFATGFAQPILSAFVEELHENGLLPLPNGAPHFAHNRNAYSRAQWMGPGKGWVDPVKEKQGAILGMQNGLSTLEIEVAENVGEDYLELLDQIQLEKEAFESRGLTPPHIMGINIGKDDEKQDDSHTVTKGT